MARIYQSGVETQDISIDSESPASSGTLAVDTTVFRSGLASLKIASGNTGAYGFRTSGNNPSRYSSFWVRLAGSPTTARAIMNASAATAVWLRLNTDRTVSLMNNVSTVLGTSSSTCAINGWTKIGLHFVASGTCELAINNTVEVSGTGAAFTPDFIGVAVGSLGTDIWFDDYIINDIAGSFNNTWPGDGGIVNISPGADSTPIDWNSFGVSAHYDCINDLPGTIDTTTYIYSLSKVANVEDRWSFVDLPSGVGSTDAIGAIVVGIRGGSTGTTSRPAFIRLRDGSGNTIDSSSIDWNVSGWKTVYPAFIREQTWEGTPVALTKTYVNGVVGSAIDTDTTTREIRWSAVWISVEYTVAGIQLASAVASSAILVASLATSISLVSASSGVASIANVLTTAIRPEVSVSSVGNVSGDLVTGIRLVAANNGTGNVASNLLTEITLGSGLQGSGTAVASGLTSPAIEFISAVNTSAGISNSSFDTSIAFGSSLLGNGVVSSSLSTDIRLAAMASVIGNVLGRIDTWINFSSVSGGVAFTDSDLSTEINLRSAVEGTTNEVGSLQTGISFATDIHGNGIVNSLIDTGILFLATVNGNGNVAANILTEIPIESAIYGAGSSSATMESLASNFASVMYASVTQESSMLTGIRLVLDLYSGVVIENVLSTSIVFAKNLLASGSYAPANLSTEIPLASLINGVSVFSGNASTGISFYALLQAGLLTNGAALSTEILFNSNVNVSVMFLGGLDAGRAEILEILANVSKTQILSAGSYLSLIDVSGDSYLSYIDIVGESS